jgi:hypothetical protein
MPEDYGKCEHAIRVLGTTYEIGLMKRADGMLVPIYDFYGPGQEIARRLGKGCEKFKQYYGVNRATLLAKSKGHMTKREHIDGKIKLRVLV